MIVAIVKGQDSGMLFQVDRQLGDDELFALDGKSETPMREDRIDQPTRTFMVEEADALRIANATAKRIVEQLLRSVELSKVSGGDVLGHAHIIED